MTEKIIGYSLLAFGIFLIAAAAVSVFLVFTKQAPPVQLFDLKGISLDLSSSLPNAQPMEVVPAQMINESSNLLAHVFLMGFIASIGQKFAFLGVQLVRPIVVNLKEKVV